MTEQTGNSTPSEIDERELFALLIESATDFAIFTMDRTGLVTSWNPGAERLLGYAASEIMGQIADVIFTPEDRAASVPEKERQVASANGKAVDDRWTMRKNGARFWASGLTMPLAEPGRGYVKIFRDLTEQHRSEVRVRENESRFRLLATNVPQLVFLTQPDGTRTWPSPQWIDFTGLGRDESLGLGWLDAIHPDDRESTRAAWEEARRNGEYHVEHRVRRASDGQYRWHKTRAHPIEDEGVERLDWVGTMTDIHDLRALKDRQQVLLAELQHRTHNQLAIVQAIAMQTIRRSDTLDSFCDEFTGRLRALIRAQELIVAANHRNIDLHTLISTELSAHGGSNTNSNKVTIQGPPVTLSSASAQALALAVHELATNALKYGALAQASGRLEVTWVTEKADAERRVVLEWRERGVTMPPPTAPRREGFGGELIRRALPYQLHAPTTLEFAPDGVRCTISARMPVEHDQQL